MNIPIFLFVSVVIFLGTHGLSIFWPLLLGANVFVLWALTVFFLDREPKLNWPVFLGTIVFFDFWSSSSFGNLTSSLLLVVLLIFMLKKIILIDVRGNFSNLIWLMGFYYLYLFINSILGSFSDQFIFTSFNVFDLALIIFWVIVIMVIHKFAFYEKKISHFQL